MKILVTGGSGFLGGHVADALSDDGHDVVVYDVRPSDYLRAGQSMKVASVLDMDALDEAMEGCDVVYHLAAVADLSEALDKPMETVETNIVGTTNMLETARRKGINRFVFASTIYVYSDYGGFYRTTKRACELLIEDYFEQYGLAYTILRFGSLYGPRADNANAIHRMLTQALTEGRIDHAGSGGEVREYIHVIDAARAAAHILAPEFKNENISLTGRERMTTGETLDMIREIMGGKIEVNFQNVGQQGHFIQTPYSYTPKIGKKLVQESYIDLGLGLLDCLQEIGKSLGQEQEVIVHNGGGTKE